MFFVCVFFSHHIVRSVMALLLRVASLGYVHGQLLSEVKGTSPQAQWLRRRCIGGRGGGGRPAKYSWLKYCTLSIAVSTVWYYTIKQVIFAEFAVWCQVTYSRYTVPTVASRVCVLVATTPLPDNSINLDSSLDSNSTRSTLRAKKAKATKQLPWTGEQKVASSHCRRMKCCS